MAVVNGVFEQSDLEKKTNDSHNTCHQNAIRCKEIENAFMINCKYGSFSLVFVVKLGGRLTEIFLVGLKKTDKSLKA